MKKKEVTPTTEVQANALALDYVKLEALQNSLLIEDVPPVHVLDLNKKQSLSFAAQSCKLVSKAPLPIALVSFAANGQDLAAFKKAIKSTPKTSKTLNTTNVLKSFNSIKIDELKSFNLFLILHSGAKSPSDNIHSLLQPFNVGSFVSFKLNTDLAESKPSLAKVVTDSAKNKVLELCCELEAIPAPYAYDQSKILETSAKNFVSIVETTPKAYYVDLIAHYLQFGILSLLNMIDVVKSDRKKLGETAINAPTTFDTLSHLEKLLPVEEEAKHDDTAKK